VSGRLAERGAVVVDADKLARQVMGPRTRATREVVAHFGAEYRKPDGSLDRPALGRLVFSDPARLAELEAIVHPAINALVLRTIREARAARPKAVVLEAIKLVEAGHAPACDEIWLVVCEPSTQLARLVGRGLDEADARQRIAAQAGSLELWRSAATRVLRTDGTRPEVERAVDAALREALAAHR
jgi:dephospho-CoA kinase